MRKLTISKKRGYRLWELDRPNYFKNLYTSFAVFKQSVPTDISRHDGVNYELILIKRMEKIALSHVKKSLLRRPILWISYIS